MVSPIPLDQSAEVLAKCFLCVNCGTFRTRVEVQYDTDAIELVRPRCAKSKGRCCFRFDVDLIQRRFNCSKEAAYELWNKFDANTLENISSNYPWER